MYEFVRVIPFRCLFVEQAPTLGVSVLIAEMLYKFHSFTLECVAFLATWYVLDCGRALLTRSLGK